MQRGRVSLLALLAVSAVASACTDSSAADADQSVGATSSGGVTTTGGTVPSGGVGSGGMAASGGATSGDPSALTFAADITPIRDVAEAQQGVFVPPFEQCSAPVEGDIAEGGEVCANVAISGCTEPGYRFADYASCDVVIRQRPYWPAPPSAEAPADDARLSDESYLEELGWVTEQIEACGCVCCHDSKIAPMGASQWDISAGPLWLDSLSDSGLALFTGLADSSVLGAYPAEDNFGFERDQVGIPTTDPDRMQAFMLAELARRGLTEEDAKAVPPFGGPIYDNKVRPPEPCGPGQGVAPDGTLHWTGGKARYLYVLESGSENPGVPPNLDLPEGTLFRLDVLASESALESGVAYGTTPAGSFQVVPPSSPAPALQVGTEYQLVAMFDVGLPVTNCLFTMGDPLPEDPGMPITGGTEGSGGSAAGGGTMATGGDTNSDVCAGPDAPTFGTPCTDAETHSECGCGTDYCAIMPGQSTGYCTATGCSTDASICPDGYSCFDLGAIVPGQPSFCTQ